MFFKDIWLPYSNSYTFESRVDEMINWFVKFDIDFATLYFPQPDSAGHSYGPDSQFYLDKVHHVFFFFFRWFINRFEIINKMFRSRIWMECWAMLLRALGTIVY